MSSVAVCLIAFDGDTGNTLDLRWCLCPFCIK